MEGKSRNKSQITIDLSKSRLTTIDRKLIAYFSKERRSGKSLERERESKQGEQSKRESRAMRHQFVGSFRVLALGASEGERVRTGTPATCVP